MTTTRTTSSRFYNRQWFRILAAGMGVVLVTAFLKTAWLYSESRGRDLIDPIVEQKAERLPVRFVLMNPPAFLNSAVLNRIAQSSSDTFTRTKQLTARVRDPLDGDLLKEIANYYESHRDAGFNAWIKRIVSVNRVRTPAEQRIEITAEYRSPFAMVQMGDGCYLVDHEGYRAAGPFNQATRKEFPFFLVIRGADQSLPKGGQAFVAPEFRAAVQLADMLYAQPYARQIAAIDVSNFNARLDPLKSQITLATCYDTTIWWGRPPHDEKFYEVPLGLKLVHLKQIFEHFHRVDANQPSGGYVDVRFEQMFEPKPNAPETASNSGNNAAG